MCYLEERCAFSADYSSDVIAQSLRAILYYRRKPHDKDGRASRW